MDLKKDNSTLRKKVSLRLNALKEVSSPSIVETHGGSGAIFARCYSQYERGVVFETNEKKTAILASRRVGWSVYEADCVGALSAGAGFHLRPNYFDIDPYGECWPVIDAVFAGMKEKLQRIVIVANCGLRQKLKMNTGWQVGSMEAVCRERGNGSLYADYLEICRDLMKRKAGQAGYALTRWAGYYCGSKQHMTHFAAVLETS